MKTLTVQDMPRFAYDEGEKLAVGPLTLKIALKHDESMGEPWKEHDGHGEVSEQRYHRFGCGTRPPKRAGERLLYWERGYYRLYNFAATMKKAKAEGWGLGKEDEAELAAKLGRTPTPREIIAQAVERDFDRLRAWCNNEWHWIGVAVTLEDENGNELGHESLWGIESDGDYWREVACDLSNRLLETHAKEANERVYWEACDLVTV